MTTSRNSSIKAYELTLSLSEKMFREELEELVKCIDRTKAEIENNLNGPAPTDEGYYDLEQRAVRIIKDVENMTRAFDLGRIALRAAEIYATRRVLQALNDPDLQ